jgi:hypothetical protein
MQMFMGTIIFVLLLIAIVFIVVIRKNCRVKQINNMEFTKENRNDYGTLSMPPSAEAEAILTAMTEEEKFNFNNLLQHLQNWHKSVGGIGQLNFHPEVRASLWGTALAKISDHYQDIGQNDRALFFMNAAWNISRYPIFAYKMALLSIEVGNVKHAKKLLKTYLSEYQNVLTSATLMFVNPEITKDELENLAKSARSKLATIQYH